MSNIITKAHPVPDMHSTGLRVVGAWLFAIVLILFSTVFVHVPYTREIQMVLAIPVLLFFGAPFYAGAWKGTRSGRNNIIKVIDAGDTYDNVQKKALSILEGFLNNEL